MRINRGHATRGTAAQSEKVVNRTMMANTEDAVGVIANIADSIGTTDNALRLLLSLFAGYPLGFIHRQFFYGKPEWMQHIYFTTCGLALGYFNFGPSILHSTVNILVIYGLLLVCAGTLPSVILAFIFNLAYLVIGYYSVMSPTYTISWTTPHCVLTLRLTGLVFDIYDGRTKPEKRTADQKETALEKTPSLLEIFGHVYFFGGFLVGPQFPMTRYQKFVSGAFSDKMCGVPASVTPAILRLLAGIGYTIAFQIGAIYFPDSYLSSTDFADHSFFVKCVIVTLWGKITLYKYLACWLIAEGICILAGLTHNGFDENGNVLWDGCANVKIRKFERADTCTKVIASFNINTNKWMAQYVFKRMKFLGSKVLSQAVTLFYLAIWHGLYSGYFMCFFLELIIVIFEREAGPILEANKTVQYIKSIEPLRPFVWFVRKCYMQFVLSYALVSFCLFTYDKWGWVHQLLYFCVHIAFLAWPFVYKYYRSTQRRQKQKTTSTENGETLRPKTE